MVIVKLKKDIEVQIEFMDFVAYEKVRKGGKTNMFDVRRVVELSHGNLTEDKVKGIISNYGKLHEYFVEDAAERKKKQLSEMD